MSVVAAAGLDLSVPSQVAVIASDEEAVAAAAAYADAIRPGAVARDRDAALPFEELRELARTGLLGIRVPRSAGGAGVSSATVAEVFRLIAVADNIAWIQQNPDEQATLLAPKLGFSESAIKATYSRGATALQPIDDTFYSGEQGVIDELEEAGIVTKPVQVQDVYVPDFNDRITPEA